MKLNPLVLICFNVLIPTSVMFVSPIRVNIISIALACFFMILSFKIVRLLTYLVFAAFVWGLIYIMAGIEQLGWISMFFAVMASFSPCFVMAIALIKDYTTAEILSALESLRLPKSIIIASTITLRYIPTFRTEFSYIKESMRLRGFSFSFLHPIRSFRFFVVPQLFRCMALSDEVTAAGMVKGIDNPNRRSSYYEQKLKFYDLACIILIFAAVIGAALW